jgi:hypothetical protein
MAQHLGLPLVEHRKPGASTVSRIAWSLVLHEQAPEVAVGGKPSLQRAAVGM